MAKKAYISINFAFMLGQFTHIWNGLLTTCVFRVMIYITKKYSFFHLRVYAVEITVKICYNRF